MAPDLPLPREMCRGTAPGRRYGGESSEAAGGHELDRPPAQGLDALQGVDDHLFGSRISLKKADSFQRPWLPRYG